MPRKTTYDSKKWNAIRLNSIVENRKKANEYLNEATELSIDDLPDFVESINARRFTLHGNGINVDIRQSSIVVEDSNSVSIKISSGNGVNIASIHKSQIKLIKKDHSGIWIHLKYDGVVQLSN